MYIILLLYLFFIIFNNDKLKRRNSFNTHYFILLLLTVLMAGLSYRMGYDSLKYEDTFYSSSYSNRIGNIWNDIEKNGHKEPGWVTLNVIVKSIFGDFTYLKLIIALFVNSVVFWFFRKHLKNPGVGILLYFLMVGWSINFEILRASISIVIFLIAIDKLLSPHPNYLKFYLYFLPALLFHWFAFVLFITPLFLLLKPNKLFIILSLSAFLLVPLIISFGLQINVGLFSLMMEERVDTYLTSEAFGDRGLNVRGVIFSLITTTIPIAYMAFSHKDEIDKKIISMSLAYSLFSILRLGLDILYRITDYYSFFAILLLGIGIQNLLNSKKKTHDIACILLLLVYLTMTITSENVWSRYVPYTSVFDKQQIQERENLYYELGYRNFTIAR